MIEEVLREIDVTAITYYRWRKEYGGLELIKELETDNARLERAFAGLTLDNLILKEVLTGKF